MKPREFVFELTCISLECVFNPYRDICSECDLEDAASRRSAALSSLISVAAEIEVDSLWVGRDLGYRGGRRTGLALTADVHIQVHAKRWNLEIQRATKGQPVKERTAAVIWNLLSSIPVPTFLWNVFPFHPHRADDPFTNRAHSARERQVGEEILAELVRIIRPRRLVTIGNDATASARRLCPNSELLQVRHPSYGGQTEFVEQIQTIYNLDHLPAAPTFWS